MTVSAMMGELTITEPPTAEEVLNFTQPTEGARPSRSALPAARAPATRVVPCLLAACATPCLRAARRARPRASAPPSTHAPPAPLRAGYCCPLTANTYGIEFEAFRIREYESGQCLFEVAKDPNAPPVDMASIPPELEDQVRCIKYDFGSSFLNLGAIGTTLQFSVGPEEVPA